MSTVLNFLSPLRWLVLLVGFSEIDAQAFSLTPVVGGALSSAVVTPAGAFKISATPLSYGGGLLFAFKIARKAELEIGLVYLPRGYLTTPTGQTATLTTVTDLQAPILLKARLLPFFTFGFGGYYERAFVPASTLKSDDYGVVIDVGVESRIIPYLNIVAHGRYLNSLQNSSLVAGQFVYLNDIQALVGLRFDY